VIDIHGIDRAAGSKGPLFFFVWCDSLGCFGRLLGTASNYVRNFLDCILGLTLGFHFFLPLIMQIGLGLALRLFLGLGRLDRHSRDGNVAERSRHTCFGPELGKLGLLLALVDRAVNSSFNATIDDLPLSF